MADLFQTDTISTVVATAGTTGLGIVDAINELITLQKLTLLGYVLDYRLWWLFELMADDEQYLGG
ncbi:MAG: hypothetical protein IPN94_14890 [Sphingobacteriales bacterium]|nr:hypothetical protein [Sphingobacteriales bacterium]